MLQLCQQIDQWMPFGDDNGTLANGLKRNLLALLLAAGPSASESPADKAAAAELAARAAQQIAALRASGTAGPSKAAPGGGSQPSGPFSAAAAAQHGQPQPEGPEGSELESNPGSQAAAWASAERDQAHSAGTASVPDRCVVSMA